MKKIVLSVLIWMFVLLVQGQGIVFVESANWQGILERARQENKYVFVDCYASWCAPCKQMDQQVYSNDTIGRFMNDRFICVKVQMDSTKHDRQAAQDWYATAHALQEQYSIRAYPSFLFFSPQGLIVHKDIGAKRVDAFLDVAKAALNSQEQYYTLLGMYYDGRLVFADMPGLANTARKLGQDSLATSIARHYINDSLSTLPADSLWTKGNLTFMSSFVRGMHVDEKAFSLYFESRELIDSIIGSKGYANGVINAVIYADEVKAKFPSAAKEDREPDWKEIGSSITQRYGKDYVERNLLKGRVEFYRIVKNWKQYAKYLVLRSEYLKIEQAPPGFSASMQLNNVAFDVFKYSRNKQELRKALTWANGALAMDSGKSYYSGDLDTKANLLYKLGRKKEALELERQSIDLDPQDREIQENYQKMVSGLPTWPIQ